MQWLAADALMLFFALVLSLLGIYASYRLSVGKPVPAEAQETFMPITRTSPELVELHPRIETGTEEMAETK